MKKSIVVMVLNWNGWSMTRDCLASLFKINRVNLKVEVVVIDNGSTDDSVRNIKKLIADTQTPIPVHLIANRKNLGFAGGNNVGIRYALDKNVDYVCCLNNDTRVDEYFLTTLVKTATKDKKIGLVGGKIYFEKGHEFHQKRYQDSELGRVIWYAGGLIDWQNVYGSNRGVDEVDQGQYQHEEGTDYVNGCLMLIKAEALKSTGGFDEKYFMYYEDTDLSMKAKKAGYKVIYCPESVIWHLNAGSSAAGSNLHDYFTTRNRLLFGLRWAPFKSKIALIRESFKLVVGGREWQKIGIKDYYLRKFGQGSWR